MPKYFQMLYGENSMMYFTQDALKEADTMGCNEEMKCPVSMDDLELKEVLGKEDGIMDLFNVEIDLSKINVDNM